MEGSKYTTKYIKFLPDVGLECPACHSGILEAGKYGGNLCRKCFTVFKLSKYADPIPLDNPEMGKIEMLIGKLNTIEILIKDIKIKVAELKE